MPQGIGVCGDVMLLLSVLEDEVPHRPFGAPPHCDGEAKGKPSKAPHRNGELSAKQTEGHPEL
jgi:hypothetical protein